MEIISEKVMWRTLRASDSVKSISFSQRFSPTSSLVRLSLSNMVGSFVLGILGGDDKMSGVTQIIRAYRRPPHLLPHENSERIHRIHTNGNHLRETHLTEFTIMLRVSNGLACVVATWDRFSS